MSFARSEIRYPRTVSPKPMTARQVGKAYNFPLYMATGKGFVAGFIELGGGYNLKQVQAVFESHDMPTPVYTAVSVSGGKNASDGPNGADGEVQSDMIVAGSIAPGASYRVYFAPNSNAGFLAALKRAVKECHAVSISWGSAENRWDSATMNAFEAVMKVARAAGVPVFVAAGDTGSQDSSGDGNQVDFPASSPSAIGCGGTRLELTAKGARASETVWDDNPTQSAGGGGASRQFPGRTVPDIAGNADPDTGYEVSIDGEHAVIGGTSLVAPLFLGLYALLWELNGGKSFDFLKVIAANPSICFDVTQGNNGGFRAGPGRDDVTGYGVPDGARFLTALKGAPVSTPSPASNDAPVSTPAPGNGCPVLNAIKSVVARLRAWSKTTLPTEV